MLLCVQMAAQNSASSRVSSTVCCSLRSEYLHQWPQTLAPRCPSPLSVFLAVSPCCARCKCWMAIAFSGDLSLGALTAFLVALSGISIFHIGAPFWGLVFGAATSWLVERATLQAALQARLDSNGVRRK